MIAQRACLLLALVFSAAASDCITRPCSSSTNFSFDLISGQSAEVQSGPIIFYPPAGYLVRIIRVRGVFTAWIPAGLPAGESAAILFALTSAFKPVASEHAFPVSDNCPLYIQDVFIGSSRVQDAFDYDTSAGGLLDADNLLTVTVASFLNTAGVKIHAEPTFIIEYRFEKR